MFDFAKFQTGYYHVLAAVFLSLGWIPYLAAIWCKVSLPLKLNSFNKPVQIQHIFHKSYLQFVHK